MKHYVPCDIKIYLDDYELDGLELFEGGDGCKTFIRIDSRHSEVNVAISPTSYETYKLMYNSSLTNNEFKLTIIHDEDVLLNAICKIAQTGRMYLGQGEPPSQLFRMYLCARLPL